MAKKNSLLAAPPYEVEQALKILGNNLRTARLRRNLTIATIAAKIGTGLRAVAEAEKGNPSTSVVVYIALLWALGLMDQLQSLANPAQDKEGQRLVVARKRARLPHTELDNDF